MKVHTFILGKRKHYLDDFSQELLFKHLKDVRISKVKFDFIVLESKMNAKDFGRPEVYSKKLAFERNMLKSTFIVDY